MTRGIVVVGSVNADLLIRVPRLPGPGETLLARSIEVRPGGKGANQAVAAALLGAPVAIVGAVGNDEHAVAARRGLERSGVDLAGLERLDGPTGLAIVQVDDAGENSIVVVPGANAAVGAGHIARHHATIATADVVVLQGELPGETIEAAARTVEGRLVLNLAPVVPIDPEIVRLADPLVVNEHEAALALELLHADEPIRAGRPTVMESEAETEADTDTHTHTHTDTDTDTHDAAHAPDPEQLVDALCRSGVRSVVLTIGAAGAVVGQPGVPTHRIPAPIVDAVDSTGAGDAFTGALAVALLRGDALTVAAAYAVRVGAFAVGGPGAQDAYPTLDDALP